MLHRTPADKRTNLRNGRPLEPLAAGDANQSEPCTFGLLDFFRVGPAGLLVPRRCSPPQFRVDEVLNVAIQDTLGVVRQFAGARVFDPLLGV